jgi:putative membrane protein
VTHAEPRRRLHPLTPLLRGGRLAVLAVAAMSWQGYQKLGTQGWLLAVGGVAVLVLAGSVVSWLVTGYHVVGRELRIYDGLVWRRTRAIPLERLQTVELVRPVLARLLGLAELRLEVVGAAKTEAPLAFLTADDATALRQRLLMAAQAGRASAATATGPPAATATGPPAATAPGQAASAGTGPSAGAGTGQAAGPSAGTARWEEAETPPERPVHAVANQDLLISQLLRPQWWFLPLAIAAPIVFFTVESDFGFIAIASMITAVIGAIQAPVRAVLADWSFTIGTAEDGLRLHRGLLETRSQTVPPGRVQAVGIEWPLLWRSQGWVRAQMHVAGVTPVEGSQQRASLLPVGTVPTAQDVIAEAVPGFVLTSVAVHPVPRRARWIVPLRGLVLGYALTGTAFVTRDGLLTRKVTIVPYARIQSVRIRQGPLQRLFRVASVWADTAGGGLEAVALHRDAAEALALATELAERSRAARRPASPVDQSVDLDRSR